MRGYLMALVLVAVGTACPRSGAFVWVDDFPEPAQPADKGYVISPGDLLNVRVWGQDGMSARSKVRNDGKISLPFLNDILAAGMTPNALSQQIEGRLKEFILKPVVTISLEEPKGLSISVVGEVSRPGAQALEPGATVLSAIANAGGLTDYAGRDRIYVIRRGPPLARIRFKYDALVRAEGRSATFRLQNGDVIVAE